MAEMQAEVGRVHICTPAYGGMMMTRYHQSFIKTIQELGRLGVDWEEQVTEGESLIPRARNGMVAKFLADPAATHLVFIDGDIEWEAGDFVRLLAHDVDVVCGLYPKKVLPIEFAVHLLFDEHGRAERDEVTGRVEIRHAATGFLCIKREAFVELINSGRIDKIERAHGVPDNELPYYYDFFENGVFGGVYLSEDYGFCHHWRAIGGRVWADPAIRLGHRGMYTFRGDPAEMFRVIDEPVMRAAE